MTKDEVEAFRATGFCPSAEKFRALCDLALQALAPTQPVAIYAGVDMSRYTIEWLIEPDTTGMKPFEKLRALAYKDRLPIGTKLYAHPAQPADTQRLWLWRNFVDGKPEYWAFDNAYPCHPNGDPMTLGQPCGYAIFKQSTRGRTDVSDDQVIADIKRVLAEPPAHFVQPLNINPSESLVGQPISSPQPADFQRCMEMAAKVCDAMSESYEQYDGHTYRACATAIRKLALRPSEDA